MAMTLPTAEELFGEQALMLRKETINRFRAVTIKNCLQ